MLTQWVKQTWREFHQQSSELICSTFRKLRLSLVVDESENHEINIKDISTVTIDDWRLIKNEREMKLNDLSDSNEMNDTNEMKMQKDDVVKYVLKDEILENERMKKSERNTEGDSELDDENWKSEEYFVLYVDYQ